MAVCPCCSFICVRQGIVVGSSESYGKPHVLILYTVHFSFWARCAYTWPSIALYYIALEHIALSCSKPIKAHVGFRLNGIF